MVHKGSTLGPWASTVDGGLLPARFIPERLHRVEMGRFTSGIETEADAACRRESHGHDDGFRWQQGGPSSQGRDQLGTDHAAPDAQDPADSAWDHRLQDELHENLPTLRPHRHTAADLVRPFRHRHQIARVAIACLRPLLSRAWLAAPIVAFTIQRPRAPAARHREGHIASPLPASSLGDLHTRLVLVGAALRPSIT
jgi:hypothetical protein